MSVACGVSLRALKIRVLLEASVFCGGEAVCSREIMYPRKALCDREMIVCVSRVESLR